MAVTNLTTTYATLCLGLTRAEGREVVVQQELHEAAVENIVNQLLVELRAECASRERLRLTTREDGASVRHGQRAHLAPDGTYLVGLTTIKTNSLVEDATAHGVALHVVVVAVHHSIFLFQLVLGEVGMCGGISLLEVGKDLLECLGTSVLLQCLLRDVVGGLVALLLHLLAQFLVVYLVVVLTLHVGAEFLRELSLQLTHGLDGIHGSLQGAEQVLLRHFLHLAFHHHNILSRSTHHDIHVGMLHLFGSRINHILAIHTGYAYLTNRALERYVGACQCSRGGKACQCIGLVDTVGREQHHIYIHLSMIVAGEERAQHAVHEAAGEDFVIACFSFTLGEAAGETTCGRVLLTIINLQRHEICSWNCIFCGADSGEEYGVVHAENNASVGLLCHFTGFNCDGSSIRQLNTFRNYVHLNNLLLSIKHLNNQSRFQ